MAHFLAPGCRSSENCRPKIYRHTRFRRVRSECRQKRKGYDPHDFVRLHSAKRAACHHRCRGRWLPLQNGPPNGRLNDTYRARQNGPRRNHPTAAVGARRWLSICRAGGGFVLSEDLVLTLLWSSAGAGRHGSSRGGRGAALLHLW